MSLKIGELADRGGVNLQTIRYYEREALLPEPRALRLVIVCSPKRPCGGYASSSVRRNSVFHGRKSVVVCTGTD